MTIDQLFERDIHRAINGVVKADQRDASSVWQELDEFVVTDELSRHFSNLVEAILTAESKGAMGDRNGIWISGFFGCGKSHLIKVLSYLLENSEQELHGQSRRAVEFFADKFESAMLYADLQKVVRDPIDTVLFNIDSKADHQHGRDALLQVFLKVLNEKQGFSSDHSHIAHLERFLAEKGKLSAFHEAFLARAGVDWRKERDTYEFRRDEVIAALAEVLGQSEQSVEKWVDNAEGNFSLTPENFAKWVLRYLDSRGPGHRLMFLVDEVGQFIGGDGHLMLSLQTITEQLGTICQGRAWVVVTSQEDLDAVLGDLKSAKQNDFSKIQGRFKTRLSLSSRNVDEVIKKRLLAKKSEARAPLAKAYEGKHDILKNQLSFVKSGHTFKSYNDVEDFIAAYPFPAYQFHLVQKVFESIRKAGATGLHLSQGERSTLDAFQSGARQLSQKPVGALAPFHAFYPAVEGFLDTAVKRTIDQTGDNTSLQPFDTTLLQVLFLIRYIEVLPGLVDNLVTLCVDEVDADRLALRQKIEQSLNRLEQETLISRNGDQYLFLTNEERDIGREIKNTSIPSNAEAAELGSLLFADLLGDQVKHTYSKTKRDFSFNRMCDDHIVGRKVGGDLEVALLTPLADGYSRLSDDGAGVMHTAQHEGRILVRLPDHPELARELRTYLQTKAYVQAKNTGTLPESTKRILDDRSVENRTRRARLLEILRGMTEQARYYACGAKVEVKGRELKAALSEALEYLIANAYPKMGYIDSLSENPKHEIQRLLRANDLEQLELGLGESNAKALSEMRDYLKLCAQAHRQVVLFNLVEERFAQRPYGWPQLEVVRLITQLFAGKEMELAVNARPLTKEEAYDALTSSQKQRSVVVTLRQSADLGLLKKARALGHELFAKQGPEEETALFEFLKGHLQHWQTDLEKNRKMAEEGGFPGAREIREALVALKPFTADTDSLRFLNRWVEQEGCLHKLSEDVQDLRDFYDHQLESWKTLQLALADFRDNRFQLEQTPEIVRALTRLDEIAASERPYGMLKEVGPLVAKVRDIDDRLVAEQRESTRGDVSRLLAQLRRDLEKARADATVAADATRGLEQLLSSLDKISSIPHLAQVVRQAEAEVDRALRELEDSVQQPPAPETVVAASVAQTKVVNGSAPAVVAIPPLKPRRVIEVKKLWEASYLETKEDVEAFLSALRQELENALDNNERVQIK